MRFYLVDRLISTAVGDSAEHYCASMGIAYNDQDDLSGLDYENPNFIDVDDEEALEGMPYI